MEAGVRRSWPEVDGYEIIGEIDRGGFGVVYEARQLAVDRMVALKVLTGAAFGEATERRFRSECKTVGALSWHHHIIALYDAGVTEAGELYLAMEHLPGGSIGARLRSGEVPDPATVARIGVDMAGALSAAHEAGVLHRDVKPDNILIDRQGSYVLTDFGIATIDDGTRSATGTFSGTYAYSAPELLKGERASAQSDIYSLGATLYTLCAGRPAFVADTDASPAAVLVRIISEEAPPLPPSVPPALAEVVARAMAKDPAQRYASAAELRRALEPLHATWSVAPPRPLGAAPTDVAASSLGEADEAPTVARFAEIGATAFADVDAGATVLRATPAAAPPPPGPGEPATVSASADAQDQGPDTAGARRWRYAIAAGVAVLLVVAGLAVALTRDGGSDDNGAAASTATAALEKKIATDLQADGTPALAITRAGSDALVVVGSVKSASGTGLQLIDLATNEAGKVIDLPFDGSASGGSASPSIAVGGGSVWVAGTQTAEGGASSSLLARVDVNTGVAVDKVELPFDGVNTVQLVATDDAVWAAGSLPSTSEETEGQILRIDRVTLKVSDKTTLKGSFPIAMTSDGNDVWVSALELSGSTLSGSSMIRIDGETGDTTPYRADSQFVAALAVMDGELWVSKIRLAKDGTTFRSGSIARLDTQTGKLVDEHRLSSGGISALAAGNGVLWAATSEFDESGASASDAAVRSFDPKLGRFGPALRLGGDLATSIVLDVNTVWVSLTVDDQTPAKTTVVRISS